MILGAKVAVGLSVAVSFGGAVRSFTMVATVVTLVEAIMNTPSNQCFSVWWGAALLWRPGGSASPDESQRSAYGGPLPRSNARGGSIPPLHTCLLILG